MSAQSVTRYIDLLSDLLLVRRLPSFHANVGKRLVKAPKVYVRDSGLMNALLGIASPEQLAGHPVVGESWEGYVADAWMSPPAPAATDDSRHVGRARALPLPLGGGVARRKAQPSRGPHRRRCRTS